MYQIGLPLLGIAIVVAVVLYRLNLLPWMRHSSSTWTANKTSAAAAVNRNPYPAVSIRCAGGCEAVQAFKGQRFLGDEAPALPLENCTASHCHCRYAHHVDRRTGNLDRRRLIGEHHDYVGFFGREDQREGRGRRASDWADAYRMNTPAH